jgi:hypothetical protein
MFIMFGLVSVFPWVFAVSVFFEACPLVARWLVIAKSLAPKLPVSRAPASYLVPTTLAAIPNRTFRFFRYHR